ncbi:718_t:CDS:2, partial [Dentiscutata heterogama]
YTRLINDNNSGKDFEVTLSRIGRNSFWDISFHGKCEDGFYFQWKLSWSASYTSVKSATT